jgi:DNA polymerase III epsilon subunit family exonuclease
VTPTRRHSAAGPGPAPAFGPAIDEADFTVVDVETTGLSTDRGDRVCEIGMVRVRGGAVMETYGTLVDPTVPISAGAYAVNGISPAMLAGAPLFPDVLPRVASMLSDAVLVAYNAPFDVGFLNNEFLLAGRPAPANRVVDALALARQLIPGRPRYPQAAVAALLGISYPVKHRALEDAMVTAKILMHFLSMLKAFGHANVSDLERRDIGRAVGGQRAARIVEALGAGGDLWIRYLSPSDGEITQRIVTPVRSPGKSPTGAVPTEIEAFCHVLQERRRFRVDCILDVRPVDAGRSPGISGIALPETE